MCESTRDVMSLCTIPRRGHYVNAKQGNTVDVVDFPKKKNTNRYSYTGNSILRHTYYRGFRLHVRASYILSISYMFGQWRELDTRYFSWAFYGVSDVGELCRNHHMHVPNILCDGQSLAGIINHPVSFNIFNLNITMNRKNK